MAEVKVPGPSSESRPARTQLRVDHFPAQDLLIVRSGDREVLVPFVKAIVPEVDIAAGHVVVTPPPGLFEDIAADEDDEESDGGQPEPDVADEESTADD